MIGVGSPLPDPLENHTGSLIEAGRNRAAVSDRRGDVRSRGERLEEAAIDVFNDRLQAEGHWVFAGGRHRRRAAQADLHLLPPGAGEAIRLTRLIRP